MVAERIDADKPAGARQKHGASNLVGVATTLAVSAALVGCGAGSRSADAETPTPSVTPTLGSDLPPMKHFRIGGDEYGPVQDCGLDGTAVTCTASWDDPYQADTYTGGFTGTLSGLEMTGTWSTHQTGHDATNPSCLWQMETSAPITYTFNSDGTVSNRQEPGQWRMTHSGSCSGAESGTTSAGEGSPVSWTVID